MLKKCSCKKKEIATKAVPLMLHAGADVIIRAQKIVSEEMGIRRTGDFIVSIGIYKEQFLNTSATLIVAPKGTDRKGVRNVEKGFILEYGLKKGNPGTGKNRSTGKRSRVKKWRKAANRNQSARPWMATANDRVGDEARAVMRKVWEDLNDVD